MERGAWWAAVHGVLTRRTQLSRHTLQIHTYIKTVHFKYVRLTVCQLQLNEGRKEGNKEGNKVGRRNEIQLCHVITVYQQQNKKIQFAQGYKSQCGDKEWNPVSFFFFPLTLIIWEDGNRTIIQGTNRQKQEATHYDSPFIPYFVVFCFVAILCSQIGNGSLSSESSLISTAIWRRSKTWVPIYFTVLSSIVLPLLSN